VKPRLTDQVVIITGASSGIGAAAAAAFVAAGARVVLAARSSARLSAMGEQLGGLDQVLVAPTDVTKPEDCERLARVTAQQFGRIDVLVNNAGIGHWTLFEELTELETRRIVETNVLGVMNAAHAVLPWMRLQGRGVIINVASTVGHMGFPMMSVYCATKFAVRGFSQALRSELAPAGIAVVCVCPGHTDTEFFEHAVMRDQLWRHGLQKAAAPEKVARRLVALAVKPKVEVVLSAEGRLLAWSCRHFPRLTAWLAERFFKA